MVWKNEERRGYQAYIEFWRLVLFVSFFVCVSRDRGPSTWITAIERAFCEGAGPVAQPHGPRKIDQDHLGCSKPFKES